MLSFPRKRESNFHNHESRSWMPNWSLSSGPRRDRGTGMTTRTVYFATENL